MISWATPALGLVVAACLIPPLILLYFLKLRRREQPIPSTLLWKQSIQDLQANALFQRLRPNWLLFLQLLVLALILLAIAQPEHAGAIRRGARTVVLIDDSASMSATDVDPGPTRLDEAKRKALEYVEGMRTGGTFAGPGSGEQIMVISFGGESQILCSFTSSKSQIKQAIESIRLTDGPSQIKQAIELARAYVLNSDPETSGRDAGPPPTMIIFSDGRISDLSDLTAGRETINYIPIGNLDQSARNIGLSALGARRSLVDPDQLEIYVRVANYTPVEAGADVDLSVGDLLVDSQHVTIPGAVSRDPRESAANPTAPAPGTEPTTDPAVPSAPATSVTGLQPGEKAVSFTLTEPRGLTLAVKVNVQDDFAVDDRAFAVIPPAKQLRVALLGPEDGWVIETAISGVPFVDEIERLSEQRFKDLAAQGEIERYDVVVDDGVLLESLPPGRYLMMGVLPPIEGFSEAEESTRAAVLAWKERHPLNRNVNYYPLETSAFKQVTVPKDASVLVEGTSGPFITEYSRRDLALIHVAFRPVASSWPFDTNMIKFIQNALDYLGRQGEAIAEESLRPGQVIEGRLPAGANAITITRPDGEVVDLSPTDPTSTTYVADRAGLYTMRFKTKEGEDQARQFAVNFFDTSEADLSVAPSLSFGPEALNAISAGQSIEKRSLWPWALVGALVFLAVEWWLYNRRAAV